MGRTENVGEDVLVIGKESGTREGDQERMAKLWPLHIYSLKCYPYNKPVAILYLDMEFGSGGV